MKEFYITLRCGQPYYPGYFIVHAENELSARAMAFKHLNGKWCSTYEKMEDVHPLDRIYRGDIYERSLELTKNECLFSRA